MLSSAHAPVPDLALALDLAIMLVLLVLLVVLLRVLLLLLLLIRLHASSADLDDRTFPAVLDRPCRRKSLVLGFPASALQGKVQQPSALDRVLGREGLGRFRSRQ